MKNPPHTGPYHRIWANHSDEALMIEIQQRGSGAFEELYRRHHILLHGVVMSVLRCESDAQDLLQSIFVAIWNGGSQQYLAARGKPLGWLITMSRRRAIDLVRKQISYTRTCDGYQAEASIRSPFSSRSVENEIDAAEYRALVADALVRLPEAQRVAIELSFFKGLSQRDIAALLGVPVGTIKTRIMLAIHKVKRCLSGVSRELEDVLGNTLPA